MNEKIWEKGKEEKRKEEREKKERKEEKKKFNVNLEIILRTLTILFFLYEGI